jgi:dolichyl-phosphate-mannose--protein O-mannosyl transferase
MSALPKRLSPKAARPGPPLALAASICEGFAGDKPEARRAAMTAAVSPAAAPRSGFSVGNAATPRNLALIGPAVFLVALAVLAPGFTAAKAVYFDETWYVPTARQWLADGQMLHPEHPPLAKMLIASGLWAFGDNPFGWRAPSLLFGALTVVAVWLWTLALTADVVLALFASAITLLDGIVFVQSRIAMLDIFLICFGTLALAAFTAGENVGRRGAAIGWHLLAGVCLGLAGACKWSGFFLAAGLVAIKLVGALLRHWGARFETPRPEDFYRPEGPRLGLAGGVAAYALAPFVAYFCCYLPQLMRAHSAYEFIATHENMIAIMTGKSADHPYKSLWWTWPALWRPVWYLFDTPAKEAGGWTETGVAAAVVGLPNPFVLFAGQGALLWATWTGVLSRRRAPLIVAAAFFSQWLPWALNPKGLEFYYYFYPSLVCLGPAMALAAGSLQPPWRHGAMAVALVAASVMFVYFLPLLASGIGVGPQAFEARIWLPTWR